ncbi:MAG: helix-turn-helix domain-containing protein [Thermodesulfobacteriota bacterium]
MDRVGTLHQARREYIRKVLAHTKGDLEQAARILGITPETLRRLLREEPASEQAEKNQPKSNLKQGYEHDEKS